MIRFIIYIIAVYFLVSCKQANNTDNENLNYLNFGNEHIKAAKIESDESLVVDAYRDYLGTDSNKHSDKKNAQQRLVQIEMSMVNSGNTVGSLNSIKNTSIPLLLQTLNDYPDEQNNDSVLYQLANAYELGGNHDDKVLILERLVDNYQKSEFYIESLFRLGESYVSKGRYIDAELVLTSLIIEDKASKFTNNARFKRAWSLYKQGRYYDAITDYNYLLSQMDSTQTKNSADGVFADNIYKIYSHCITYIGIDEFMPGFKSSLGDTRHRLNIYHKLASVLTDEDRAIDAAGVFMAYLDYEQSTNVEILGNLSNIWKNYKNKEFAINQLVNIEQRFGKSSNNSQLESLAADVLRSNLVYIAEYYHALFQKKRRSEYSNHALHNYSALLSYYPDNINLKQHLQYAELLQDTRDYHASLKQYQAMISTYNDTSGLNKAAISILSLASKLLEAEQITSVTYAELHNRYITYIGASEKINVMQVFASHLYNTKKYAELVLYVARNTKTATLSDEKLIFLLAASEYETKNYEQAAKIYEKLYQLKPTSLDYRYRLSLAMYKQAEYLGQHGDLQASINLFNTLIKRKLDKEIELLAMIDISSLYMRQNNWQQAITSLENVRTKYPNSKFERDITNKLSVAYLNANDDSKAAREFELISKTTQNIEIKRSALWQSAELYESSGDKYAAIRSYREYAKSFLQPVSLNLEAINKLTELYRSLNNSENEKYWLVKIINISNQSKNIQNDRMRYLASKATLALADYAYKEYLAVKLTIPLDKSLKRKKSLLSELVKLLQDVNKYHIYEDITEAIYITADTYYLFSQAINQSQRPTNLSAAEMEQYNILLEDQAIIFEDQAIRYYQQNINSILNGRYSQWVGKSFDKLARLFPSKYSRDELIDTTVKLY